MNWLKVGKTSSSSSSNDLQQVAMASMKPFSLTTENLKEFEKQLKNQNRGETSLQRNRNVERTEADGQSSGIQSYGSQLSAFKENLRNNNNREENKQVDISNRKYSHSLDRPEPEAFRRNPDGQSRNESWHATPNVVRIDYGEGSDHISYKSNSEEENTESDNDDDDEDSDDDDDDEDSEEESSESEEESDEEDEDDDDTDTIPPRLQETPVSVRTHYSSSLNASSSSIPTIASVKSKAESTKTTKTERQKSAASNVSSAPSYIVNTNQFRMKKMAVKKEKERQKLGVELIESDLSRGSSRTRSAVSGASIRERGTTSVQSRGSYINVRNWSRWSNYSGEGYSISEGPEINHRYRKLTDKKTAQNMQAKTPRARPQSRTEVPHLPVIGKKAVSRSQPDLSKASKRHVTLTFPDLTRTRSVSRSQMTSRKSTRSIIKPSTARRIKSVPDLNREAVMSFFQIERGFTGSVIKTGSKRQYTSRQRQAKEQDKGLDDERDRIRNRRKRVLKRKERPKRNATADSSASSTRSIIKQRSKRGSAKDDERSPLSSALSAMSSLKSREIETGRGGKASSSASSKASVVSRGPRMKPIRTYAGYQSNQELSSSRVSLLASATPISVILQRSPSLRSAITEYSSYLSLAVSSVKSARYSSRSSLSSTGKKYYYLTEIC